MDLLRTNVDAQVERRIEALQEAGNSEELQQSGEMDDLMGRARDLWERKEGCRTKITTLEAQKQELENQRTQSANERSHLRNQIRELTEERTDLMQQLAAARAQPPSAAHNSPHQSPEAAFTSSGSADARICQLQQECERLN